MEYRATLIAQIPSEGFDCFLFLLEDIWSQDLSPEFSNTFGKVEREVRTDTLIVNSDARLKFSDDLFEPTILGPAVEVSLRLPALVITNTTRLTFGQ
jgi:hypothetical protein